VIKPPTPDEFQAIIGRVMAAHVKPNQMLSPTEMFAVSRELKAAFSQAGATDEQVAHFLMSRAGAMVQPSSGVTVEQALTAIAVLADGLDFEITVETAGGTAHWTVTKLDTH
jgi:hypothetical protein